MLSKMAAEYLTNRLFKGLTGLIGNAGGLPALPWPTGSVIIDELPGRAAGGPVDMGRAYMVGERGPELFVPGASGQIVPSGAGAGGNTFHVHVHGVTDAQSFRQSEGQIGTRMAQQLELYRRRS